MISTKGRYALRLMVDIATYSNGYPVALKDSSARQNISIKYLEQVVSLLVRGHLLISVRGNNGGYILARDIESYNAFEILSVAEGSLAPIACLQTDVNLCERVNECSTIDFWKGYYDVIKNYTKNVTLLDLVESEKNKNGNDYNIQEDTMSRIYKSIDELVGHTPLIELRNFAKNEDLGATVIAKIEGLNPAGSVKDRVAKSIIDDYEAKGVLKPGSTIIEPTSGNTGIGLAAIAAAKGYRVIITLPETMSVERRNLIKAYGAELALTDGSKGMKGAIEKANELNKEIPNSIIAGQFVNPANPKAHYETTGPEIWEDTDGNVDIFVSGVGTGGTISGVGKYLKEKNPNVKIVAVEPQTSAVLSTGVAGPHKIQGIGAGFIPETLDTTIYDEIITVPNEEAFSTGAEVVKSDGIFVGISSGAALYAAKLLAQRPENKGKNIVVLLPDNGDRYLSTPLFSK